jgi:carboxymethylenebutenolidase
MAKAEHVTVKASDGTEMRCYVSRAANPQAPGLIVIPEAFGVNAHHRQVCDRFSETGYTAIAPEVFHRTAPAGWEGDYNDFASVMPHYQAMTLEGMEADLKAAAGWLKGNSDPARMGCTGFCLGGRMTFLANAVLPLKAAASFYGGGIANDMLPLAKKQNGPIVLFWGGQDKHIPLDQVHAISAALKDAGKDYTEVVFSEADHAFMNNDRSSYHKNSADDAWAHVISFFKNHLG